MVKVDHKEAVNEFAKESLQMWVPFFIDVLGKPLPESSEENFSGSVTLKVQVIRVTCPVSSVFGVVC
jgi:hypothetical protein